MTGAEIKNWSDIVFAVLKPLAVVAAGLWALTLVPLLRQRAIAQTDLRKKEAELRDLDLKAKHTEEQAVAQLRNLDLTAKETEAKILDLDLKCKQQAVVRV